MDCTELITKSSASNSIPKTEILQLFKESKEEVLLVSSYTESTCYIQAYLKYKECIEQSKIELLSLYKSITCVTLVENHSKTIRQDDYDSLDSSDSEDDYTILNTTQVAIIIGTDKGTLQSHQIKIELIEDNIDTSKMIILLNENTIIKPLPMDILDEECIQPKGGITQLQCYKIENTYRVIWVIYLDGTCIRLSYNRFFDRRDDSSSLPPIVTKWDKNHDLLLPLYQSSIPLFRPPNTTSYHHITEGIAINNQSIHFVTSEEIQKYDDPNRVENTGYETFTDGIVSGTKTVIKDMFGSVMGRFGWTSNMIYDAVDIAYYRKSTVLPSQTKTIEASNDPWHFLKSEAEVLEEHEVLVDGRNVSNVYIHPYLNHNRRNYSSNFP